MTTMTSPTTENGPTPQTLSTHPRTRVQWWAITVISKGIFLLVAYCLMAATLTRHPTGLIKEIAAATPLLAIACLALAFGERFFFDALRAKLPLRGIISNREHWPTQIALTVLNVAAIGAVLVALSHLDPKTGYAGQSLLGLVMVTLCASPVPVLLILGAGEWIEAGERPRFDAAFIRVLVEGFLVWGIAAHTLNAPVAWGLLVPLLVMVAIARFAFAAFRRFSPAAHTLATSIPAGSVTGRATRSLGIARMRREPDSGGWDRYRRAADAPPTPTVTHRGTLAFLAFAVVVFGCVYLAGIEHWFNIHTSHAFVAVGPPLGFAIGNELTIRRQRKRLQRWEAAHDDRGAR